MQLLSAYRGKHFLFLSIFSAMLAVGMLFAGTVLAQINPTVDASIIRNFARVSFSDSTPLKLRSASKGRQIRLRFDKEITFSPAPLLAKLRPYVVSISQSDDKRSVLITTNRDYRTRSFVSGNSTGIDIIGLAEGGVQTPEIFEDVPIETKPAATPAVAAPKPEITPAKPKITAIKPTPKPPAPAPLTEPSKPTETVAIVEQPIQPAAPIAESIGVLPVIDKTPDDEMIEVATPIDSPVQPEEINFAQEKAPITREPEAPEIAEEAPTDETVEQEEVEPNANPVEYSQALSTQDLKDGIAITFPWQTRTAATVFRRGNRTFLLFNSIQKLNADSLRAYAGITKVDNSLITGLGAAQLWVIETSLEGVSAIKKPKSYHWRIELKNKPQLPEILLNPQSQTELPLKPHLFIPVLEISDPINFYDIVMGDELTAVPIYSSSTGLVPARSFAQFSLPKTSQGIVIENAFNDLSIIPTRNGLKISSPDGIYLSDNLPQVELPEEEVVDSLSSNSFFPYQNWLPPLGEDATSFEGLLWRQAADADVKKRRVPRKRLAELYLAQGKALEARTLLQMLAEESPIYFTRNKLHAMLGAAHFMANEFLQAETAFKHPTLDGEPEINLWRDVMSVILRKQNNVEYTDFYDEYIRHYPPMMRQNLALVAADNDINNNSYNKALKIFDTLNKDEMLDEDEDHVQYLIARVLAGTTQKDAARLIWQKLADETANDFIRPRALFAITNLDLAENKITIEEAIKQLEPIRIMWRGDDFEITLLTLLGRLYEATNQYREQLRTMREIITYFPNHPENLQITANMADIFRTLFNDGAADELSPIDALALYYEFRNLTPIGEAGDIMIQNLADRLSEVELLDRSAALLENQVEFRLSGEERSRVGARLALIHLLRRKPKQALSSLELTGYGNNPESLQQQRTLLTARALMGLKETERALKLLEGDDSREAKLLALEIYWDAKTWPELIQTAEQLMAEREDPTAPLNDSEVDILMKLGIGYVFAQQSEQLQYLRDYFLPLMEDADQRDLFSFITEDTLLDYRNITKLSQQIGRMESFLANYKNKMKAGGVSSAVE